MPDVVGELAADGCTVLEDGRIVALLLLRCHLPLAWPIRRPLRAWWWAADRDGPVRR